MSFRRAFRGVKRGRACRFDGCDLKVGPGVAYCPSHAKTPEADAFRRELQGATAYLELAAEALDPDQVERAEAFQRFRSRARRGQFDQLLEAPTRRMLEQAAAVQGFDLELGALRYGLMRVMTEETDPTRMALALARLSNAVVRATGEGERLGVDPAGRREDAEDAFFGRAAMVMGRGMRGTDKRKALEKIRAGGPVPNSSPRWELARRMMAVEDAWLAEQAGEGAPGVGGSSVALAAVAEADRWAEEDEDRADEALALKIAAERAEAARRSEEYREMSEFAVAGVRRYQEGGGWEGDDEQPERGEGRAERRVARSRR